MSNAFAGFDKGSWNPAPEINHTLFPKSTRDGGHLAIGAAGAPLIGSGEASCEDLAAILLDHIRCNLSDAPKVVFRRQMFRGPLADINLGTAFGQNVDMITSANVSAKETSGNYLQGGSLPFAFMVTGIYAHLIPAPFNSTVEGGSFTAPTAAQGATKGIVVPDVWLSQDATANAGSLNVPTGSSLTKAFLDVGGWTQRAFYWMARAYNWQWQNGDNIIMNYPLRSVAKVVPVPESFTMGQARKNFVQDVADCNAYYRAPDSSGAVASSTIFLARNATRTGTLNNGGTPVSTFEPYSYFDEAVTFGGPGVEETRFNNDYFPLQKPIIYPSALNLGMSLNQISPFALSRMQRELSITNSVVAVGAGGAPPGIIYPDTDYSSTTTTGPAVATTLNTGGAIQVTQDSPPVNTSLLLPGPGVAIFKIGDFWVEFGLVGWGISDATYISLTTQGTAKTVSQILGREASHMGAGLSLDVRDKSGRNIAL